MTPRHDPSKKSYPLKRALSAAIASNRKRFPVVLPVPILNLCVALWLLIGLNLTFWRSLWQAVGGWDPLRAGHLLTLPIFVLACVWLTLELLTWGRAARPVLVTLLLLSATASYFMGAYGIVFDHTMVANLIETDPAEALELLNWRLWMWLAVFGVLPGALLWRVTIPTQRWSRLLLSKGITVAALIGVLVVLIAPFFQSYASLFRNHRDLRLQLVPTNYLSAIHSYARRQLAVPEKLYTVGTDARVAIPTAHGKPRLLLLVVGETARAANFSLNGYARQTNPELATQTNLVSLQQVSSCGTSTAVSLPCMFLDVGHHGFKDGLAKKRESLLDVLQRAGIKVLWRDNNSGCKGVCDRVPNEDLSTQKVPGLCNSDECWDEILLQGLEERLDRLERDTIIVLHMKGSHGPAYYLRVPPTFEQFKPACQTNQLDLCAREAIVNAYDNTIRYTDHVLARGIELLKRHEARIDSALIYVSDHGESLGEYGMYLHGLPYTMAPKEQTHVPMLLWLPTATQKRLGIEMECMQRRQDEAFSHDNLYHTVLRMFNVQTSLYHDDLDLFSACGIKRNTAEAIRKPLMQARQEAS